MSSESSSSSSACVPNLLTIIARTSDFMILVISMNVFATHEADADLAKKFLQSMKGLNRLRKGLYIYLHGSTYYFHYIIKSGVMFLTLAEANYPKKLTFVYLEELAKEFLTTYATQKIASFSRPYAAVDFEPQLNRLRRSYFDSQSEENMRKLNSQLELQDIHRITHHNFNEVVQIGKILEVVENDHENENENENDDKICGYVNSQVVCEILIPLAATVLLLLWANLMARLFR